MDKDGILTIEDWNDLRGHQVKFRPIGKDLWQAQEDQQRVFAIRDSGNRVVRIAFDFPGVQFQRVPWYEMPSGASPSISVSLGIWRWCCWPRCMRIGRRVFLPQASEAHAPARHHLAHFLSALGGDPLGRVSRAAS